MGNVDKALEAARRASNNSGNADNLSVKQTNVTTVDTVTPLDNLSKTIYAGKASSSDASSLRIPVIYGEVFTRGLNIDGGTVLNTTSDLFTDRTLTKIMSEAPTAGIPSDKQEHVVINKRPLKDPSTGTFELRGTKVKDISAGVAYTASNSTEAASETKLSAESTDVNVSILNDRNKIDQSVLKINTMQGLDDVTGEVSNKVIPFFNTGSNRFELRHLNDVMQEVGVFTSTSNAPSIAAYPQSNWFLQHSTTLTVDFNPTATNDVNEKSTGSGPSRWYKSFQSFGNTEQNEGKAVINDVINPDLIMFRGTTYNFVMDSSNFDSGYKFYIGDQGATGNKPVSNVNYFGAGQTTSTGAATGNSHAEQAETLVITPDGNTPDLLYYTIIETTGSELSFEIQGRILVRDV